MMSGGTLKDKETHKQFAIFVISVTVVISNLLVGLTVSVVAQLLEYANMAGMEFKLEQIISMGNSLLMKADCVTRAPLLYFIRS